MSTLADYALIENGLRRVCGMTEPGLSGLIFEQSLGAGSLQKLSAKELSIRDNRAAARTIWIS
jgi:hypothetical protein